MNRLIDDFCIFLAYFTQKLIILLINIEHRSFSKFLMFFDEILGRVMNRSLVSHSGARGSIHRRVVGNITFYYV